MAASATSKHKNGIGMVFTKIARKYLLDRIKFERIRQPLEF